MPEAQDKGLAGQRKSKQVGKLRLCTDLRIV